jgi:LPS export ABC transporter protein LptC
MGFSKFIFVFSFGCACLLSACVNDMEKIKQVTFDANDPDEKTRNLKMVYSDSGMAKLKLYAPIAETFTEKDGKIVQFNEGVLLEFYKSDGRLGSSLTAQYGEINETTGKMMVRDSVRMFNTDKKQTMETEVLYWNKKDSTIFTDQLVTIKTPKMLIFGKGLKTKQDFSSYEFLEPQGRIKIDK